MQRGRDGAQKGGPNLSLPVLPMLLLPPDSYQLSLQLLQLQSALSKTLRIDLAPGCVYHPKASKLTFLSRLAEGQAHCTERVPVSTPSLACFYSLPTQLPLPGMFPLIQLLATSASEVVLEIRDHIPDLSRVNWAQQ